MTNEEAHEFSRKRGTSWVYAFARIVLTPIAKVWYRFKVTGAEIRPGRGPGDHRAQPQELLRLVLRRAGDQAPPALHGQVRALRGPLGAAALRPRRVPGAARDRRSRRAGDLAPPSRAGPRARAVPRGHALPRPGRAQGPRKGAGRLAIEPRAPIVPCAISGTERCSGLVPGRQGPGRVRAARSCPPSSRRRPRPPPS